MYEEKARYNTETEWLQSIESQHEDRYFEKSEVDYGEHISKGGMITHDYIDEAGVEVIGDKIYIQADFSIAQNVHPFKSEKRDYPLFYESAQTKQHTIQFDIPEGYSVESIPEPLSIGLPSNMLSYNYNVQENNNKLLVQIIEKRRVDVIAPDYYPALKEMYDQIITKQKEKIVLTKL